MQVARETLKGEGMTDGEIGTGTGTGTDTATDTTTDTVTGTETEIGTDTATEIGTETGTGTDTVTDTVTKTKTKTRTGTVVETETDIETATKAAAEAEVEAEAETELDAALHQLLRLHHLRLKGIRIDADQAPVLAPKHTPTTPTRKPLTIRNFHPLCRNLIFKTFLCLSQVILILIPTMTSLTTSVISMSIGMTGTRTRTETETRAETEIQTGTETETKTDAANSEESAGKKSNSAHVRHKRNQALLPWLASPAGDMSPTVSYGAKVTLALAAVGDRTEVNDSRVYWIALVRWLA